VQVTIEDLIAEEDKVAARVRFCGTHQGELEGLDPTGRRVESTGIVLSRIEGGKIAEDWANFDDLGLMRQLGAIPEPEEQAESLRWTGAQSSSGPYSPSCLEHLG
jgi:hypothetical protein